MNDSIDPPSTSPGDSAAELSRAESLAVAGKPEQAERLYRRILSDNPGYAPALNGLALVMWERGDPSEAESMLRLAIAGTVAPAYLHNSLGVVLQSRGALDEAQACYRAAIALDHGYAEAHYNLGVLLEEAGLADDALAAYRAAVAAQPRYARALTRLGRILVAKGAAEDGLAELDRAIESGPHYFDARYYRGALLSSLGRHQQGLADLRYARALRPDSLEAALANANALRDAALYEQALNEYWRAMELQPSHRFTHEQLNRLAWASGRSDLYLRSFEYARRCIGPDPELLLLEAAFHMRRNGYAQAEELLWRARALAPRGDILGLLARAQAGQNRFDEAYAFFEMAVAAEPDEVKHRYEYAAALLRDGQPDRARLVLERGRELKPHDQLLLAGLSLAYRELDDSRYRLLMDPSRYIKTYDIRVPGTFAGTAVFNQALAQELKALHTTHAEPIDQTLRGGTQTLGKLFAAASPLIGEVRNAISEAVSEYIRTLPADQEHPTVSRKTERFDYIGSWSCSLASQGFHTNHMHPMGWISSAYYVSLPQSLDDAAARPGWLKFGESNLQLGSRDQPEHYVRPEVGRLVLFPSFYWHGTVPFDDEHDRLSIAFDVVPGVP